MKKAPSLILLLALGFRGFSQATATEMMASGIAQRMQDSLSLTEAQKQGVYEVTLQIQNRRVQLCQRYAMGDSLRSGLFRVETERDSLYKPLLTQQQFGLYTRKKAVLVR